MLVYQRVASSSDGKLFQLDSGGGLEHEFSFP